MLSRCALEKAPKVQPAGVQAKPIRKCAGANLLHQSQMSRAVEGTRGVNSIELKLSILHDSRQICTHYLEYKTANYSAREQVKITGEVLKFFIHFGRVALADTLTITFPKLIIIISGEEKGETQNI